MQEGLSNVARHAGASTVRVRAALEAGRALVSVADDGDGYDPSATPSGLGLTGMRERAVLAGGDVRVDAHPGAGTLIELRLGTATGA